jgi:hypothetical protein
MRVLLHPLADLHGATGLHWITGRIFLPIILELYADSEASKNIISDHKQLYKENIINTNQYLV